VTRKKTKRESVVGVIFWPRQLSKKKRNSMAHHTKNDRVLVGVFQGKKLGDVLWNTGREMKTNQTWPPEQGGGKGKKERGCSFAGGKKTRDWPFGEKNDRTGGELETAYDHRGNEKKGRRIDRQAELRPNSQEKDGELKCVEYAQVGRIDMMVG